MFGHCWFWGCLTMLELAIKAALIGYVAYAVLAAPFVSGTSAAPRRSAR